MHKEWKGIFKKKDLSPPGTNAKPGDTRTNMIRPTEPAFYGFEHTPILFG